MSTIAELERLEALLGQLLPLSGMQRGELIEAEDWNQVVEAVMQIGRAALADPELVAVAPHEHTDQVGIGWLDARVRELLTGGGLKDPALDARFSKLERNLNRINTTLDRLLGDLRESRNRIDEVATSDLVRNNEITRLNRKVLGAADDRADIADLRSTLRTIEVDVARAVDVGARLELDGAAIDVVGLARRVGEVEQLRERLTQPSGELLDAMAFERRLLELETSLVTESDLTKALGDVRSLPGGGEFDLDSVLETARATSREVATEAVGSLGGDLRSELDERLSGFGPQIRTEVDRSTEGLADEVLAAATALTLQEISGLSDTLTSEVQGVLNERLDATNASVDERLTGLNESIARAVLSRVDEQLQQALEPLVGQVLVLQANLKMVEGQVGANEGAMEDFTTQLATQANQAARDRADMRAELHKRIETVEGRIDPTIRDAITDARSLLLSDVEATVAAARRDLEVRLAPIAREAAQTEVQVLSTSIRNDVSSIVRAEIDSSMADARKEISAEVAGMNQRVAGLVVTEVKRATAEIPALIDRGFEAFQPEINRMIDRRVGRLPIDRPPIR